MSASLSEVSTGIQHISETYTSYDTSVQGSSSVTESYRVVYTSPDVYKVDIIANQTFTTLNATAWVLKNGTALAYYYLGQNVTGREATGLLQGLMSPFFYEAEYNALVQTITPSSLVHNTTIGTGELDSARVVLTNYSADSLPLTVPICGGSLTLSSYALQTGTVQGASQRLLTFMNISGDETFHGHTNQIISLSYRITSFQLA